ncbi:MAG: hypothetical protein HN742_36575 [Lentisphaerae bacterium]|jgi:signal transduction histidine kinase/CheY-like chemotaxis protein|nr:hypothetical protein [Lentisphaerota bacterium]MBT4821278.1 hypothetical protein [Lentisphaerota bacterium]MBT5604418.1 hypothetical protein [Lentisphaerota bacterium]MBT7058175.1 hypothetical protein [Lentisphaerota bacterium]MBT7847441.1 hypothetical protein [Lentisphaerota bacterium]
MEGVLIASADAAIRRSLAAIVGEGKTVHECASVSETLALAAAQKMDFVFVDDVFRDGDAQELASRLHLLGYGGEVIPILLADAPRYLAPFRSCGVRRCVTKPFDVSQVNTVIEHLTELAAATASPPPFEVGDLHAASTGSGETGGDTSDSGAWDVDIREISQRFRRLLSRSLQRDDLVAAFSECMQEQFDIDNVVVLLPAREAPCFRIVSGHVDDEVREQFVIPFGDPLIAAMVRLGEPVWVSDQEQLGPQHAPTAMRYGERLGVRILCSVTSRGRALALVGLSRVHRYDVPRPSLVSLLRLFLTFFGKALENAGLYSQVASAEQTYRGIFDAFPVGAIDISPEGAVRHLNPQAASLLDGTCVDFETQPIERADTLLADAARETLSLGVPVAPRRIRLRERAVEVSAVPLGEGATGGVLLLVQDASAAPEPGVKSEGSSSEVDEIIRDMSRALAHNFKNAFVPIKTCAELLPERYAHEGFRESFFDVVQDSTEKIDRWIRALMRLSELTEAELRRNTFQVSEALDAAAAEASQRFPELEVTVDRNYAEGATVNGNRDMIVQGLVELIVNAFDAIQDAPDPRVRISVETEEQDVVIRIEDNGRGIEPRTQKAAFRPFYTKKLSGLGLGLTYAMKVVELHTGSIEVGPGADGGTLVKLEFPFAPVTTMVQA